jgi:hypothetical protein
MHGSPPRPFVPRVTSTRLSKAVPSAEFTLSRPFVPGAERAPTDSVRPDYQTSAAEEDRSALPSIDAFLETVPEITPRPVLSANDPFAADFASEEEELPPVEHFVDPMPSVGEYGVDQSVETEAADSFGFAPAEVSEATASDGGEWGETDWQQFDWRSAARLGETGDTEATNAWAATDWDASVPQPRQRRPTAAQALATALDEIAKRIRDGELALPMSGMPSDAGSIAASLAALLGMNR